MHSEREREAQCMSLSARRRLHCAVGVDGPLRRRPCLFFCLSSTRNRCIFASHHAALPLLSHTATYPRTRALFRCLARTRMESWRRRNTQKRGWSDKNRAMMEWRNSVTWASTRERNKTGCGKGLACPHRGTGAGRERSGNGKGEVKKEGGDRPPPPQPLVRLVALPATACEHQQLMSQPVVHVVGLPLRR